LVKIYFGKLPIYLENRINNIDEYRNLIRIFVTQIKLRWRESL